MMYYEILNADDSVIRRREMPDGFDPADVAHKFGTSFRSRLVPEVVLPDPVPRANQRLGATVRTVNAANVTVVREVVALTAEELAARAEEASRQTEIAQIRSVALDLRDGAGTAGERLGRCERVLFRLLKDNYGS